MGKCGVDRAQGNNRDNDRVEFNPLIGVIHEKFPSSIQIKSQIYSLTNTPFVPKRHGEEVIRFVDSELATTRVHVEQPLVITATIRQLDVGKFDVRRVLIDTGASRDILYYPCYKALGLSDAHLTLYGGQLEGFSNHKVGVKGTNKMQVTLKDEGLSKIEDVHFMVMDLTSPYNAILGQQAMVAFHMVTSVPH